MKILVTGATGFIGTSLLQSETGHSFRPVIKEGSDCVDVDSDAFIIKSLGPNTCWEGAFSGVEAIIHLAGLAHSSLCTEKEMTNVNYCGTLHFARKAAAAGVKRFVFVSSINVSGNCSYGTRLNEATESRIKGYPAAIKKKTEDSLITLAKKSNMEVTIVRPVLVYGIGAPGNIGVLIQLVTKLPLLPFGAVRNKRSFLSVKNLTDFLCLCCSHPKAANEIFIISDGEPVSTKVFLEELTKGLGVFCFQLPVPSILLQNIARALGFTRQANMLLGDFEVDISKAREVLSWTPAQSMPEAMLEFKNKI